MSGPPKGDGAPAREDLLRRLPELLSFEGRYLTDKMVAERMARSPEEVEGLFRELKKHLVLGLLHPERHIPMFSRRVDEVWHQLVLFTVEYAEFCRRFFGKFIHHAPDVPGSAREGSAPGQRMTFAEFAALYEPVFGEVSPLWRDELALCDATRLIRADVEHGLSVRESVEQAELVWNGEPERLLLRVDARCRPALDAIARWDVFHLRELPATRHEAERVALCAPLVQKNLLWVAP